MDILTGALILGNLGSAGFLITILRSQSNSLGAAAWLRSWAQHLRDCQASRIRHRERTRLLTEQFHSELYPQEKETYGD